MVKIKSQLQNPKSQIQNSTNFVKFLGTAGARFVMIEQLRASGGIWVSCQGTNVLIDPGPGSLVRCHNSRPKLDPLTLDALVLTHKHLDHSNDINVMIEAMTEGGFKRRGTVFCPRDALGAEGVILNYARKLPQEIKILDPRTKYKAGNFSFQTSMRHTHSVETFGLKFKLIDNSVGIMADTRYFSGLDKFYKTDILIISVVFLKPRPGIDHLCLDEAEKLIRELKPKKAILTHFGMTMLSAQPHLLAENLTQKLGLPVIAAYDGMTLQF